MSREDTVEGKYFQGDQFQGPLFPENKTALSTPFGRSGPPENHKAIFPETKNSLEDARAPRNPGAIFPRKNSFEHARWMFRASRKLKGQFLGNGNLERYFHAVLHLVCMVLEGELSICLIEAKQPSNTVTNPREERLAVDA